MHKINICVESKVWKKHCSSIDKKIKQILKRSIESEKIFRQKEYRNYSFTYQFQQDEIS